MSTEDVSPRRYDESRVTCAYVNIPTVAETYGINFTMFSILTEMAVASNTHCWQNPNHQTADLRSKMMSLSTPDCGTHVA